MNAEEIKTKVIPTENDVLCGRGNGVNLHPGNQKFRAMIKALKPEYVAASKPDKSSFPYLVVAEIQNAVPPGRFMKYCPKTDQWHELPTKQAITKTRQALREGAPDIVESQKGNPRKTAVYVVDEIKKIVVSLLNHLKPHRILMNRNLLCLHRQSFFAEGCGSNSYTCAIKSWNPMPESDRPKSYWKEELSFATASIHDTCARRRDDGTSF